MLDAKELKELNFTHDGVKVEATRTFVTEYGEIYIGLLVKGCWVNIKSSDFAKRTKSLDGFYTPILEYNPHKSAN
jgi:hypothetical protein